MLRPAVSRAEKMIKVDHAGENGAVNIYRAQKTVCLIRASKLLGQLASNQSHEEEHRQIFASYLAANGIRRCISYHLCGAGGYVLGLVTGLMGPGAVAATTYAVEHVVLRHLEEQLDYLKVQDPAAHDCVTRIVDDERAHHETAESQMQKGRFLTRVLVFVVSLCTESVIRFGMRHDDQAI
jgi:ubiquinone biosynthesis monooxygenase Coq7